MKLAIEKHPEISKLLNYFKKIESIAEEMGMDVDELIEERKKRDHTMRLRKSTMERREMNKEMI